MTKRINAKYKVSRRLGVKLWGENKTTKEKNYPPGQHGPRMMMRRRTDYGIHLLAKQKLKCYYGNIREKQFRALYLLSKKLKGDTGENLVGLLESRLDAIVYRSCFAPTIFAARQFVNHKHIMVNGKVVNVASYRVKPGDQVSVNPKFLDNVIARDSLENSDRDIPAYISMDKSKATLNFVSVPMLADVPYPVIMEPNLIVEYYSR
ncbi:MAG: 30S ribosomal protein S4 [Rickettsiales bacterium]|jgi:small subunit ribosomal protein S4|nr:30S ribosomal protein S4 [Rickettsiales bacterium]